MESLCGGIKRTLQGQVITLTQEKEILLALSLVHKVTGIKYLPLH